MTRRHLFGLLCLPWVRRPKRPPLVPTWHISSIDTVGGVVYMSYDGVWKSNGVLTNHICTRPPDGPSERPPSPMRRPT